MYDTDNFEGSIYVNKIYLVSKLVDSIAISKFPVEIVSYENIQLIIEDCENADLVVLYDLDFIKIKILFKLKKTVIVAWRFFGYELYSRTIENYLAPIELDFKRRQDAVRHKNLSLLKKVKLKTSKLKRDFFFNKALKRLNYILILCDQEYEELSVFWTLPKKIVLPSVHRLSEKNNNQKESKGKHRGTYNVVIGNNTSIYNNHLSSISLIEDTFFQEIKFIFLLNYGPQGEYLNLLRENIEIKKNVEIIDNFLPAKEFSSFYRDKDALFINGYRQMAVANIFQAIEFGVKIYLNSKSSVYNWLISEGFLIFTEVNFLEDQRSLNLRLSPEEIGLNFQRLLSFNIKFSKVKFQERVRSHLLG